jgi:hypothetical protein
MKNTFAVFNKQERDVKNQSKIDRKRIKEKFCELDKERMRDFEKFLEYIKPFNKKMVLIRSKKRKIELNVNKKDYKVTVYINKVACFVFDFERNSHHCRHDYPCDCETSYSHYLSLDFIGKDETKGVYFGWQPYEEDEEKFSEAMREMFNYYEFSDLD